MFFQHVFRNLVVKPTGPGALSDSIPTRDLLTSFFEMGDMRLLLIEWFIRFGTELRIGELGRVPGGVSSV